MKHIQGIEYISKFDEAFFSSQLQIAKEEIATLYNDENIVYDLVRYNLEHDYRNCRGNYSEQNIISKGDVMGELRFFKDNNYQYFRIYTFDKQ